MDLLEYVAIVIISILVIIFNLLCMETGNITGGAEFVDEKTEINQYKKTRTLKPVDIKINDLPNYLPYREIKNTTFNRKHIGQRKLLLTEILFLCLHGDESRNVIYVGAAPAIHTVWLAELFPEHTFHLWDPAKFKINLHDTGDKTVFNRIHIYNNYFTDNVANDYIKLNGDLLFVSDIRSGGDNMSFNEFENRVNIDNTWQRNWIGIMNPKISMLKFRIPFNLGKQTTYEYLDGDVYLQPWAPIASAETRLITTGKTAKTYDSKIYENQMYYFNNIIREHGKYKIDERIKKAVAGAADNFDCAYEVYIWEMYYNKFGRIGYKQKSNEKIENIIYAMNHTSQILHRGLTEQDKNLDSKNTRE